MAGRPLIGLPTQTQPGNPAEGMPDCWIMSQKYVSVVAGAGGTPNIIPLLDDMITLRAIYDELDGIFLCGGVDIDPTAYDAKRHFLCGTTDPDRDATEIQLVRWAVQDHKPVFGVCRGVQVINVACGGTLHQDVAQAYPNSIKHDYFPVQGRYERHLLTHSVEVDAHSDLGRMLGVPRLKVNSMHHQAIDRLGNGLIATSWSPDGVVESVESINNHYLLGVQWHPEELADTDPRMRRLFRYFIREASRFRDRRLNLYNPQSIAAD
ncbi:MAG: gamma-glutamyl-gamma-aminobutyrate hydrolase family protein [Anaerolineales bacterium]|nr:gamma-glutamyl-gamma-aminobutyrate hydrolase family protein [Anaerolineales bacterium]MCB9129112.1 gamma-glutamyl-gamma-aminobutyrate hydrolase family protein [Ardenticatenales bacterium]